MVLCVARFNRPQTVVSLHCVEILPALIRLDTIENARQQQRAVRQYLCDARACACILTEIAWKRRFRLEQNIDGAGASRQIEIPRKRDLATAWTPFFPLGDIALYHANIDICGN